MSYPYAGMVVGGAYLMLVALRRLGRRRWRPKPAHVVTPT